MEAEKRIRTVDHHEWTLKQPAHHTEVEKTVAVAEHDRAALASRGVHTGDVHVHGGDDALVVSFQAERPKNPQRHLPEHTDA
ncbi:hypothetical protein [Streptomyces sp. NPDC094468]|uniref:hypothetical protein n=1 Tax=Streptomyces sp. NPDC094468 TaxID=3366066 RepID=UPI0037FE029B